MENANKHGLCKKQGGGTVWIRTRRKPGLVTVIIQDDGAGFDPGKEQDDRKVHVGLGNVRKRIESMCRGTMLVESEPEKGTRITILLPQTIE